MSDKSPALSEIENRPRSLRVARRSSWRVACLGIGLASGIVLARTMRRPSRRKMPHLGTFQRALAGTHGEVVAAVLAAQAQERYNQLYAARPRFSHPVLQGHLDLQILPGLALYEILRENAVKQGLDTSTALKETGALIERMDVLARWLPLLRYQSFAFAIFRRVGRLSLALFPAQGWDIQMVEDSPNRFAFNISRCFYVDVLTAYGAPELTQHFCHLDDVAYAALPPGITWERTTTLARGGSACDFCWRATSADASRDEDAVKIAPR
jgi:L-2-amino-thiazoline-4-carboxylic acid hydrolase-like protein